MSTTKISTNIFFRLSIFVLLLILIASDVSLAGAYDSHVMFTDSGQSLGLGNLRTPSVELADLNGDGYIDAFVTSYGSASGGEPNRVWLNNGSGIFSWNGQNLGANGSYKVALGDLNGDGYPDAFVANSNYPNPRPNRVWINDKTGHFFDSGQRLGATHSGSVDLGDVDGDGDLDAFVVNSRGQSNRVWFNDGAGNFTDSGQRLGGNSWSNDVELADLDGDGDLDAFVVNSRGTSLSNIVWINDGHGNFIENPLQPGGLGNSVSYGVSLGDLNDDGTIDAFVANASGPDFVWFNNGDGTFTDSTQRLGNNKSPEVILGDLDSDGDLDAFVASENVDLSKTKNLVWLNDGNGNFTHSGSYGNGFSLQIALADLDNDGDLDAFVANDLTVNKVWFNVTPTLNEPPIVGPGGPYSGNEGTPIPLDEASASDQDDDFLSFLWDVDSPLCSFDDPSILHPSITCDDNGDFIVTLTISDDINDPVSASTTLTIYNVCPSVGDITVSASLLPVGDLLEASAPFTDPGIIDTHTAEWEWGDGSKSPGDVIEANGSGTVYGDHIYSTPGVYTVTLTVWDEDLVDCGVEVEYKYVVVYDPSGGFVTGGGWIISPEGAYLMDLSLTGKASFGFVSKYKKGAAVPTGVTEFVFHTAGLNFHSSAYEWLVVNQNDQNAQFKGSGKINRELAPNGEAYHFMLWAGDGDPDTFRIKIWYEDGDEIIVYDNGPDQEIGGGSIVIHKGK